MDLILTRVEKRPDGIISKLTDANGNLIAWTLEHSYDGEPKVPNGLYVCARGEHELIHQPPFETFEVMRVIGHSGILFHVGNFNEDSEGCILLGEAFATVDGGTRAMVTNSKVAFAKFMAIQYGLNTFQLSVVS